MREAIALTKNRPHTGENYLKGPYERLKYDLRRVWECPLCQHRVRTGGDVVFQVCRCQESIEPVKRVCMRLIEDGVRRAAGR